MGLTRIRAEQISDIDYKQAVRVIELSNVNLSGGAPSTVDGVSLNNGDRILVAGQTNGADNGIYYVVLEGTGSSGVWQRTVDAQSGDLNAGFIVMVTEGSTYNDTSWKLVTNDPIVVGTTPLLFLQNTGNSFSIINVIGSANVVANAVSSTVSFASGNNFSITGNNAADIITFSVSDSPSFIGNVSGNYFIGNGSQLTGVNASNFNANSLVGNTLSSNVTFSSLTAVGNLSLLTVTGNVQAGNVLTVGLVSATGNVTGDYVLGNGYYLTGVAMNYGNSNVANYLPTYSGNLTAGNISATGNIAGNYYVGNGYYLTGIQSNYGNANVADYLPTYTGNLTAGNTSFSGTVVGAYFTGDGSNLSGLAGSNVTGTVANATYAVSAGYAATVTANTQANITGLGTLGNLTVTGNTRSGNLLTPGLLCVTGNIRGGNVTSEGIVTAIGNVYGSYIFGNGSQLSSISGSSVTGTVANATYAVSAGYAATVTANSQPNITSVGALTSLSVTGDVNANNVYASSILSAIGNVYGNYIVGNGSALSYITGSNVTGTVANATYAVYAGTVSANSQPNITSVGTLTSLSVSGDVNANNVYTVNVLSAVGNVYGNYIVGNGSTLSGIAGGNVTGTVANATYAVYSGTVTANSQPNITSVGTLSTLTVTGNTLSGNLLSGGLISVGGNILGNSLLIYRDANILGNLNVQGNVTFNQSNVIVIGDLYIELANNASTYTAINGAGLQAGNNGTSSLTNWTYSTMANAWSTNVGISAAGNVSGTYILGNGYYLTGLSGATGNYGNSNVADYLPTYTGNLTAGNISTTGNILTVGLISTSGNVIAAYYIGNGSALSSITGGNVTGTVANATYAVYSGTVSANSQPNITSVGNLSTLTVTGNTQSGNLLTAGVMSATGNVTGAYFVGNGSALASITGGNVTGTVANATYAVSAGYAATVTANSQPNITSVGTLTSLTVTGTTQSGNLFTGGNVSATGNVYANNISVAGTLSYASIVGTSISATGNISGGNLLTTGSISAGGNITVGNVSTAGNVSAAYYFGNGYNLTGLANVTFDVAPPSNAIIGDIWIDSNTGIQYIYFNDITGYVWAEMEAQTSFSSSGYANLTTNTTNTQVLYNASNAIVGSNNLTFDGTTLSAQGLAVGTALQLTANSILSTTNNSNLTINTTGSASYINMLGGLTLFGYGGNKLIQTVGDAVSFYAPTLNSTYSSINIIGSLDGNTVSPIQSGVMLHISGQPTLPSRIYNDGANAYAAYIGRMYNGNASAPTQLLANTTFTRFAGTPYGNTGFPSLSTTRIDMVTTEDQTATNRGSQMTFWTTPQGSNVVTQVMSLTQANLSITGNIITSGNIYGNVNANYGGNLSAAGDVYIAGNLSVAGTVNYVPGTYGSFANTANITAAATNTAYPLLLDTAIANLGITLGTGASNSRMIISKTGTYLVNFNAGVNSATTQEQQVYIWLRKNGTDVANSSFSDGVSSKNTPVQLAGTFPILAANVSDYIEVYWATSDTGTTLVSSAAQTTPWAMPASPSIVVNITPVSV